MAKETQRERLARMEKLVDELNQVINAKEQQISDLQQELADRDSRIQELESKAQRGGRKARFTPAQKETIKMYRIQGKTIAEIADMFDCSVGLIHKIINEK